MVTQSQSSNRNRLTITLACAISLAGIAYAADPKVVVPANGVPLVGPYSPGLDTGDYVYVSGQGVRDFKSQMPAGIDAQATQCIENVRGILTAAGLTLDNVVSVQLYLTDMKNLPVVEKIYQAAFVRNPARVTLIVPKMPTDTTVEITVIARKATAPADRVFLPAVYGATLKDVDAKLDAELRKAGMTTKNLVSIKRYVTGNPAPGFVPVFALPGAAKTAAFAVASKTPLANTAYCEVVASDPKGSIEVQTTSVFGKLKSCLEAKGLTLSNAVATNVYLDDINDFAKMNAVYAGFFPDQKPTRTTIQPTMPLIPKSTLVRISALAAK